MNENESQSLLLKPPRPFGGNFGLGPLMIETALLFSPSRVKQINSVGQCSQTYQEIRSSKDKVDGMPIILGCGQRCGVNSGLQVCGL